METRYKPEEFDPFIVFNPSIAYIKRIVKELKDESYEALKQKQRIESEAKFTPDWLTKKHARLIRTIGDYEFRLHEREKTGSWELIRSEGRITDRDREAAKRVPITEHFSGNLRATGRTRLGLCPFHNEKTPSFNIYVEENRYHCFGCGAGGDSIDFISRLKNFDFITSVKYLLKITI